MFANLGPGHWLVLGVGMVLTFAGSKLPDAARWASRSGSSSPSCMSCTRTPGGRQTAHPAHPVQVGRSPPLRVRRPPKPTPTPDGSTPTQFPEVGQARGERPTVPHVACAAAPLRSPDRLSSRRVTRAAIYKGWWQCLRGPETPSEGGRRGGARRQTICRGNASYANRGNVGAGSCRHWLTGRKSDERARVATVCR